MFGYQPTVNNRAGEIYGAGLASSAEIEANARMRAAEMDAQSKGQLGQDISGALVGLASAYANAKDKKKLLDGMDKSVSAMSDMGAITTDFRDKYMAVDQDVRPFLFEAIASPMFKSYTAGQSASAQAQAWDKYRQSGGGGGGDEQRGNNKYGYRFGG